MLGIDDPEENKKDVQVLGFVTLLNIINHKTSPVISEIIGYIKSKSKLHNQAKHQELT